MRLGRYILKRLAVIIPQVIAISALTFILTHLLPGNPVYLIAGPYAPPERIRELEHQLRLDLPIYEQYFYYLADLVKGDWGTSTSTGQPVLTDLAQRFPATMELITSGLVLAVVIGVSLGVITARSGGGIADKATFMYGMLAGAIPEFFFGLLAIYLFYFRLHLFPTPIGRLDPGMPPPTHLTGMYTMDSLLSGNWPALKSSVSHLGLPVLTFLFVVTGGIIKTTRQAVVRVMDSNFVNHLRASGFPESMILPAAFRTGLPPVLSYIGITYGYMLGGAVLIETIFGLAGMGQYSVQAIIRNDYLAIQGFVFLSAVFLLGIYLVVDVITVLIDPRIAY